MSAKQDKFQAITRVTARAILRLSLCVVLLAGAALAQADDSPSSDDALLQLLNDELAYHMEHLVGPDGIKPYFLAYTVTEARQASVTGTLGAVIDAKNDHRRWLDVEVRVGDYALDNTHKLRDAGFDRIFASAQSIPLKYDADAIRQVIWLATDEHFKEAVERYAQVQTNIKIKVEEEDQTGDFSREKPSKALADTGGMAIELDPWKDRIRRVSAIAREFPDIYRSQVGVVAQSERRWMVTSEGTRLQTDTGRWRVSMTAATTADDGMDLSQSDNLDARSESNLPDETEIVQRFRHVINDVLALRRAPLVEPYSGPAILLNRASGVFFHEIFGHRIEGHRQKDVEEGQTFTKKLDQRILPDFISIFDDPTREQFGDQDLLGSYAYDDEGVPASNVTLIDEGVLKTFLLSRTPVAGFEQSNGHGRRQPGRVAVSRQGNLIIESTRQVTYNRLREMLVEECNRQNKPFGLLFEDITGGFTTTTTQGPQAFKVLPVIVYRIYPDGRPDELVRGVDIVGTPLSCLENIVCTGDDPAVFNGMCGAESGWVPVSAVSPSILVSAVEIEKRERSQDRPPLLQPPVAGVAASGTAATN